MGFNSGFTGLMLFTTIINIYPENRIISICEQSVNYMIVNYMIVKATDIVNYMIVKATDIIN